MANIRELRFDDLPEDEPQAKPRGKADIRSLTFEDLPDEPLTALQGGGALASGFNRMALSGLPGMPAKTALDVADLVRAGYGYIGNKLGLVSADDMPEPLDRRQYAGSPEWIAAQIERSELGRAAIDNPRPDNPTARILNAGGGAVAAGLSGRPADMGMQFGSGVSGQVASEMGAPPEWAMLASMGPQVAKTGAWDEGRRRALRGGEEGRLEMERRLQTFRDAGMEPTVGLATGNRRTQAIESALAKTPGGAGLMARRIEDMNNQLGESAGSLRDRVSDVYGPVAAGEALKQGITGYRERQQQIYGAMNERAMDMIPPDMRFPADAMRARGAQTLADIEGAPNVSQVVNKPLGLTQDVLGALEKDVAPRGPQQVPSRILQESGEPFQTEIPGTPGGIPIEGLRGLKSRIGAMAYADNPLLADANTGALKHLYSGAKADLLNAGSLADAERIARGQQPGVRNQMERADRFYSQTQTILDKTLKPIFKAGDPASERGYYRLESDFRSSGKEAMKVMASLPVNVRKQVTATAIDRMGKAAPGQQNADGSLFSPQTFLTNYVKLAPEGKAALFSTIPSGQTVRAKLDSIAKSAEMIRDANKVYANPSGTAQATNVVGAATGLASGLTLMATGHFNAGAMALGGVLSSMTVAHWGAKAMTNPRFVTWLSQSSMVKPSQMRAHLNRLALSATQEKDPEQRAMLEGIASDLWSEFEAGGN